MGYSLKDGKSQQTFIVIYTIVNFIIPRYSSMKTSTLALLEPKSYEQLKKNCPDKLPERVYFNKGL